MVKGFELRIASAMELLQTYKKEQDECKAGRDNNAQKEAEELRIKEGIPTMMRWQPQPALLSLFYKGSPSSCFPSICCSSMCFR
jgi:hypothetical protein